MKKYIVVEAKADEFQDVFDTIDEANKFALDSWNHLTNYEKKGTHIYVCFVTEKDLADYARDEETGEIDWRCFDRCDMTPDCFDSEEYDYEDDLDLNETSVLERLTDPDLDEKIVKKERKISRRECICSGYKEIA